MTATPTQFAIDRSIPEAWRVTFDNPPLNLLHTDTVFELLDLVAELNSDPTVKVVLFDSANPDYFIGHYDMTRASGPPTPGRPPGPPPWIDFISRLSQSPVLSIASVRGRARGVGAEFLLACDIRFASREKALLGQPEVGLGLVPGGGASERLPLLVGRARALEIILGSQDFDGALAERYGWVNRAVPDADLDGFVNAFVRRIAGFDRPALREAKRLLNRSGLPSATQTYDAEALFFAMVEWPGTQRLLQKAIGEGLNAAGDLELNLGSRLG